MARTHSATSLANLRPFQPGISGNPGGRPSDRDPVNYALKKTHGGREMFDVLISIALDRGAKKHDRIAAAAIVLDR